jgi:ketosteroid isomerase-like protein
MKTKGTTWLAILMLVAAGCLSAPPTLAAEADENAVRDAAARFYVALNALFRGDVGPMTQVWSHADDVTYMGPGGGFEVGWPQVRANWEAQAAKHLGGEVKPVAMRILAGQELAVVQNYEQGENTNAGGKPAPVSIRATHVFRKEGGQWKMIGHHTDLLPYLEQ